MLKVDLILLEADGLKVSWVRTNGRRHENIGLHYGGRVLTAIQKGLLAHIHLGFLEKYSPCWGLRHYIPLHKLLLLV